jgi:predicted small secreted protein
MKPDDAQQPRMQKWARALRLPAPLLLLSTLLAAACTLSGTGPDDATLDRETFIAVYVELRVMALQEGAPGLTDTERQEVLDRHQVTEEQLLEFANEHGGDVPFMRDVWDEIEARLDAQRGSPSSDPGP